MTDDRTSARTWSLVLESQGIEHQLVRRDGGEGWDLVVHPRDAERASEALAAYLRENPPPAGQAHDVPAIRCGRLWPWLPPVTSALLFAFHLVTGPWSDGSRWFARGEANGARILDGEVWRTLTALTLHADAGHALANAVALALFGLAACSRLGPGKGVALTLAAGALGNALNVLLRGEGYLGVGASTAVFGAVGLLAGLQMAGGRKAPGHSRTALISGLLLLVLLGMGVDTDVLAHVLGFAVGTALGIATARWAPGMPPGRAQAAWALAAIGAVCGSWWLALR